MTSWGAYSLSLVGRLDQFGVHHKSGGPTENRTPIFAVQGRGNPIILSAQILGDFDLELSPNSQLGGG